MFFLQLEVLCFISFYKFHCQRCKWWCKLHHWWKSLESRFWVKLHTTSQKQVWMGTWPRCPNLKHPVDKWHCGGAPITVCLIVFSRHLMFSYFQLSEHYCSRLSSVTKLTENPDQETSAHTYILSNCCMAKELDTHGWRIKGLWELGSPFL